jgi:zinc transport system permease protein
VIPAVTALRLARSFRTTLVVAVACSLVSVLVGMMVSFYLDIAAGGAIVLTALVLFGAATLARRETASR